MLKTITIYAFKKWTVMKYIPHLYLIDNKALAIQPYTGNSL